MLGAIGAGERAYSTIERRSGVEHTSLVRSLKGLQEKRMVLKQTPYSSRGGGRHPRYVVADPYLRFWLRFIGSNLELIERGRGDVVVEQVRASWDAYRGRAIEPLVGAAIERRLPDPAFGEARFAGGVLDAGRPGRGRPRRRQGAGPKRDHRLRRVDQVARAAAVRPPRSRGARCRALSGAGRRRVDAPRRCVTVRLCDAGPRHRARSRGADRRMALTARDARELSLRP